MRKYIVRITSPDDKGLIYRITGVLYREGCNLTSTGEFVDHETGTFFMRSEFDGEIDRRMVQDTLQNELPGATITITTTEPKDIVAMVSKEYHVLGDLLLRHGFEELNANIKAVVSNHENLRHLVESSGIPFHHIPVEDLTRREHEEKVINVLDSYNPDVIILAKYMRILTPEFVALYAGRILNIHHSFLPAFVGASPYAQAYRRGVKIIGATAHFVNEALDEGPIISQGVLEVDHGHSAEELARAGRDVEKTVLAKALNLVLEDRVFVHGNRTVIFD